MTQILGLVLSIAVMVGCADNGKSPKLKRGQRDGKTTEAQQTEVKGVESLKLQQKGFESTAIQSMKIEDIEALIDAHSGLVLIDKNQVLNLGNYSLTKILVSLKSFKSTDEGSDQAESMMAFGIDGVQEVLEASAPPVAAEPEAGEEEESAEAEESFAPVTEFKSLTLSAPKGVSHTGEIAKINLVSAIHFLPTTLTLAEGGKTTVLRGVDADYKLVDSNPALEAEIVADPSVKSLSKSLLESGVASGNIETDYTYSTVNVTPYQFVLTLKMNNSSSNQEEKLILTYVKSDSAKANNEFLAQLIADQEEKAKSNPIQSKKEKAQKAREDRRRTRPKTN